MISSSDLIVDQAPEDKMVLRLNLKIAKVTNSHILIYVVIYLNPQLVGAD